MGKRAAPRSGNLSDLFAAPPPDRQRQRRLGDQSQFISVQLGGTACAYDVTGLDGLPFVRVVLNVGVARPAPQEVLYVLPVKFGLTCSDGSGSPVLALAVPAPPITQAAAITAAAIDSRVFFTDGIAVTSPDRLLVG